MPVEFVGGLFGRNQLAPRSGSPRPDLPWLRDLARAHEHAGFDRVLVASGGADQLHLATYAALHTEKLGFMVAHRPGVITPVVAARAYATVDHIIGAGRLRLHTVTGHAAEPQHGDTLEDKAERYARASEYLDIVKGVWTSDEPFDYEGKYFRIKGAFSPLKPLHQPHIPVSLGGTSEGAYHVAVKHTDLYALWAEPLADTKERIDKLRSVAAAAGVPAPRVSLSARLIIGPTEELAWKKAREIAATLAANTGGNSPAANRGHSGGAVRQLELAARGERHDRALFLGTSSAIGFGTDSTALVGTPDTIVQALLDYYDIGVTTFLNRGYEPLYDALDYGRWILPAVREEVRRRERQAEQPQKAAVG